MHRIASNARAGFTLVEILAVILIIGILVAVIVPALGSGREAVRLSTTRTLLDQLSTEIEAYATDTGDYPPSTFPKKLDPKPTRTNMGIESLVIALFPADGKYQASFEADDRLCNTDGDNTKTSHTIYEKADAFEIRDAWENPIVYLHRRDYEKGCSCLTYQEALAAFIEEKVTAATNPTTGSPFRKKTFQLISAGPDGKFGTGDDVGNFDKE